MFLYIAKMHLAFEFGVSKGGKEEEDILGPSDAGAKLTMHHVKMELFKFDQFKVANKNLSTTTISFNSTHFAG